MEDRNRKQFKITEDLFAKFHKRFFNYIIDIIVLSILLVIGLAFYIGDTPVEEAKAIVNRFMVSAFLQYTVVSCLTLVYFNFFEIFTSRTIGKFCTNTIVVDENGEEAGYEAIMIRSLIRIIPMYWVTFLFFPTRGLHDLLSKTYVVDKKLLEENKRRFYNLQTGNGHDYN